MTTSMALALLLVAVFALTLRMLRLGRSTQLVWRECIDTGQLLRSDASELEKERAARRAALTLGRTFVFMLAGLALALALPLALMYALDVLGIAVFADLEQALLSAPVLIAGAVLTLAATLIR